MTGGFDQREYGSDMAFEVISSSCFVLYVLYRILIPGRRMALSLRRVHPPISEAHKICFAPVHHVIPSR
jgi:hypothetical protein